MNKEIGKIVLERRKALKLTQKQLAEKLFVTDKAVSKWECQKGYPDIELIPRLAETLEIDKNILLFEESNVSQKIESRFIQKRATRLFLSIPVALLVVFGIAAILSAGSLFPTSNIEGLSVGWSEVLFDYFIGWLICSSVFGFLPLMFSFMKYFITLPPK